MIKIYDSRLRQKVDFIPIKSGEVRIYVCGPTVYDDAHLGHARSAIVFDLLRRLLTQKGYKVLFIKNFTDIDDKIIAKCFETNQSIKTLTTQYINSYLADMSKLNVLPADKSPLASNSLESITLLIEKLIEKNIAYRLENGDIYLNVAQDSKYGSISLRGVDDENIARIKNDVNKKDVRDFVLWKAFKGEGDIGYESPLGKGRPGWHIECSAMIEDYAYKNEEFAIDIHAGGADLLFPHHENEASQTRCASGREIAKYWMHNGFVNINGEKMSKSLGNSFFVKDALSRFEGEILRNYLLGVHYRLVLHFNEEDLAYSKKRLDKIYRLKKRISGITASKANTDFREHLLEAMSDDLNISKALSIIEEMLNNANHSLDTNPKNKDLKAEIAGNLGLVWEVLGIGGGDEHTYFQQGISQAFKEEINALILKRIEAKKKQGFRTC